MGRVNAGKTTILQRVCNTVADPEVFDGNGNKVCCSISLSYFDHGRHNIKDELVFQSNPGFVFHDSCGFEGGSVEEFEKMRQFVVEHAMTKMLEECIHGIWYCIPMTDHHRTILAAEKRFFDECETGNVPVMVLLTKVDALNFAAVEQLQERGCEFEEAKKKGVEEARNILHKLMENIENSLATCKFPPQCYLPLTRMHEETADCTLLMNCTASALTNEGLQKLLISTQQNNIALNIEYAVRK
ncbi:hypothetical protein ID866_9202 [Astraeus odoratus]|nr:hypothetical protein ID866_9202 [Astraeus odoratus]